MAHRGVDTLRFGPMKPVGLDRSAHRPPAVRGRAAPAGQPGGRSLQPRRIPDAAEMGRAGARAAVDSRGSSRPSSCASAWCIATPTSTRPRCCARRGRRGRGRELFFAGQISGVEGYVESAASGLFAGINAAALALGRPSRASRRGRRQLARWRTTCRMPTRCTTSPPTLPSGSFSRSKRSRGTGLTVSGPSRSARCSISRRGWRLRRHRRPEWLRGCHTRPGPDCFTASSTCRAHGIACCFCPITLNPFSNTCGSTATLPCIPCARTRATSGSFSTCVEAVRPSPVRVDRLRFRA